MRLVLASNNAKKLIELQALVRAACRCSWWRKSALGIAEADEPHGTFVENALAKARHAARARQGAGDRRRLRPVRRCARRRAGRGFGALRAVAVPDDGDREQRRVRQDAANTALLLQRMRDAADRRARFVSTLVALRHAHDPEPLIAFGRWELELLHAPRGSGGFGYDPLVRVPDARLQRRRTGARREEPASATARWPRRRCAR